MPRYFSVFFTQYLDTVGKFCFHVRCSSCFLKCWQIRSGYQIHPAPETRWVVQGRSTGHIGPTHWQHVGWSNENAWHSVCPRPAPYATRSMHPGPVPCPTCSMCFGLALRTMCRARSGSDPSKQHSGHTSYSIWFQSKTHGQHDRPNYRALWVGFGSQTYLWHPYIRLVLFCISHHCFLIKQCKNLHPKN